MNRKWQLWLGILVSALFLYFALAGLKLDEVWQNIKTARYIWLVPGVLVYFLAVWGRTWRWHYLLASMQKVRITTLFPIVVIGYMGNNIYPARAGEILRAYILKCREGISISSSLATILVERVFDGVVMLFFVFVSLPLSPMAPHLRHLVIWSSILFFGILGGVFLVAAKIEKAKALYRRGVEKLLPDRFQAKVESLLDKFMEGLEGLRRPQDVLMVFLISIFIWLMETTKYWFVMHGFEFRVPFYVLMLMTAVVNLATTLPSSPGYIGTFDAPGIKILVQFGVPGPTAAGYTLVLHAALWLPITLLGIFYMFRESLTWKEVQAEATGGSGK